MRTFDDFCDSRVAWNVLKPEHGCDSSQNFLHIMFRSTFSLCVLVLFIHVLPATAQTKRSLDHEDVNAWNRISSSTLSNNGKWIAWVEAPERGDGQLRISSADGKKTFTIPRGASPVISGDNGYIAFKIIPQADSVRQKKLAKANKKDMPTDSLGIIALATGAVQKFAQVQSFQLSTKAGALLAYKLTEEASKDEAAVDSSKTKEDSSEKPKHDKKTGTHLIVLPLTQGAATTYKNVTDFAVHENGTGGAFFRESKKGEDDGAYTFNATGTGEMALATGTGNYVQLTLSKSDNHVAFLTNSGDFEAEMPSFSLMLGSDQPAREVAKEGSAGIPASWWVSEHGSLSFSDSGNRLFFGTAPRPEPDPKNDDVLDEEKVKLDLWNWQDSYLQPMQLVQADRERKRTYDAVFHINSGSIVQLATEEIPSVTVSQKNDGNIAMGTSNLKYRVESSWESPGSNDVWVINVQTGASTQVLEGIQDSPRLSPEGKFITYWDRDNAVWKAVQTSNGGKLDLSSNAGASFVDDLDDREYEPDNHGQAGWTEGDAEFIVYDKYDIWGLSPSGSARNITKGKGLEKSTRYTYTRVDREEQALPTNAKWKVHGLNLTNMDAGYYDFDPRSGSLVQQVAGPYSYQIDEKASDADVILWSRSNYKEFPNLLVSGLDHKNAVKISNANPQQSQFNWGSSELYEWTSLDGELLKGILYKPEGFDASKKYPMMVYFYEKNSTGLNRHIAPSAGGSSINYTFYVSRGYVLFVPDIPYKSGYPGESAMNAIMPGITSLIDDGFVDRNRIGVQGHSWGGYQIAYMVTQTNLFAAAEAGAPVVNMTSAYGGIRWASGMSRMFQYERTQSRIGGTLWNAQQRYIHNSPLFQADKVQTPLLMMHNDNDGAVPWYQGIEYFVALRRLGKPVWMANYNGAGHGLSDLDERRDWQIRMQQFFDHYLMDAPAPVWLERGIPAVDKGKTMGLELVGQ